MEQIKAWNVIFQQNDSLDKVLPYFISLRTSGSHLNVLKCLSRLMRILRLCNVAISRFQKCHPQE